MENELSIIDSHANLDYPQFEGKLDEVLSLSDRILVMFDGNIVGERINKDVTDRELGLLMAGVA